jgi:pimeloyl-ACP methyl ester carboxylesterase
MNVEARMHSIEIERMGSGDCMVVCVHGIWSDHLTFRPMLDLFGSDPTLRDWDLAWFDYDFNQQMAESGRRLADEIDRISETCKRIVIIAHSMGGLVARFAILDRPLPRVNRLIMLGTPNCGAIRSAGLSWLAQAVAHVAGNVYGLFTRRTGIRDLTRVTQLFRAYHNKWEHANHVEYITIPGKFYHRDRSILDPPALNRFTTIEVATEFVSAMQPLFRVGLERPHDGIVEESSNRLAPSEEGSRWSEKKAIINFPERRSGQGYAHITSEVCADLTHVELHTAPEIISIVARLIVASDFQQFRQQLRPHELSDVKISPDVDGRW